MRGVRQVLTFGLFEAAFYFAYRYGMSFSQASASPFWFPDSVGLPALLLTSPGRWWLFILGTLPIRLFSEVARDVPAWFLLSTFALDSLGWVLTAAILRRVIKTPIRFETLRQFALFCLFAVLLIPGLSALGGATARHALGHDFWLAWEQWFLGNALAHLVITPALLYWVFGVSWRLRVPPVPRCLEAGGLAIGLIVTGYLAFATELASGGLAEPLFYAPVPFLFWAAIRFGMLGASGGIAVIAFFAGSAAVQGYGPFAGQSPVATAAALQQFLLLRAVPLYVIAILIEQTGRVDRDLREARERTSLAVTAADLGLWEWDIARDDIWFQPSRAHLELGRTAHANLQGFVRSLHPDDREGVARALAKAMNDGGDYESEYRVVLPDGRVRWIAAVGRVEFDAGRVPIRLRGVSRDVTRNVEVTREVEQQREALGRLSRVAVLGELSGSLAHELNQPLTAILSNAQAAQRFLVQEPADLDELRAILDDIIADDRRAGEIIHRLRALFRHDDPQLQPIEMNDLVRDVLMLARSELVSRHVELSTDFAERLPVVSGDRVQLQQVVLNLITNACHAMADGGVPDPRLTVRTACHDAGVQVTVSDCGPGIPLGDLTRIFDPFFTTRPDGMGLGLTVCRTIIGAHKGTLWVENNPARGARVHFVVAAAAGGGAV